MKKIICIVLCLCMIAASLCGCISKKLTFEEAAKAGKDFIKNDKLKDIKIVSEADDNKVILEGKYDPANEKAVFSVSLDSKDTVYTLKEMIKLDGKELYIRIPDVTDTTDVFGDLMQKYLFNSVEEENADLSAAEEYAGYDGTEDGELSELEMLDKMISGGAGVLSLFNVPGTVSGKYVMFRLPENKFTTLSDILTEAEQSGYEKAEKLEPEENYPYVVKFTQKDAYDLLIAVLDGIKENKTQLSKEASGVIEEYLGEDLCDALKQISDRPIEELIGEGMDEFFNNFSPEDIAPEDAEKFEAVQKIAYETDKRFEYVFIYELKDGEEIHSAKITMTVTCAEEDESFAEKCKVSEKDTFDVVGYFENILNNLKMFSELKGMFEQ